MRDNVPQAESSNGIIKAKQRVRRILIFIAHGPKIIGA
jgi:hypothetical protein